MTPDEEEVLIRAPLPIQKRRVPKRKLAITDQERSFTKVIFDVETDILFSFYTAFPEIRMSAFLSEIIYEYLIKLKPEKIERLKIKPPPVVPVKYHRKQPNSNLDLIKEKNKVLTARKVMRKKDIERILEDAKNERSENGE